MPSRVVQAARRALADAERGGRLRRSEGDNQQRCKAREKARDQRQGMCHQAAAAAVPANSSNALTALAAYISDGPPPMYTATPMVSSTS